MPIKVDQITSMENMERFSANEEEKKLEEDISKDYIENTDLEADRENMYVEVLESMVNQEAGEYAKSMMEMIRNTDTPLMSGEQMIAGLAEDALKKLKAADPSLENVTSESKGVRELVRRGLMKALEAEMGSLGSDDLEALSRVEKVIDSLSTDSGAAEQSA